MKGNVLFNIWILNASKKNPINIDVRRINFLLAGFSTWNFFIKDSDKQTKTWLNYYRFTKIFKDKSIKNKERITYKWSKCSPTWVNIKYINYQFISKHWLDSCSSGDFAVETSIKLPTLSSAIPPFVPADWEKHRQQIDFPGALFLFSSIPTNLIVETSLGWNNLSCQTNLAPL